MSRGLGDVYKRQGQATDILEMFQKSAQYEDFEVIKDYGGIERALYCRKK